MHGLSCSPVVPPGLSARGCGTARSASLRLAGSSSRCLAVSPLCLAADLCPSYWSGRMFLLYLLGCQTSIQFNFLSVLVVFKFVVLLLVVQGDTVCPLMPPSWLEVQLKSFISLAFPVIFIHHFLLLSFSCARRHSVSTYASILARSPNFLK